MRWSFVLGRVAVRAGVGLWRQRFALLAAAFVVVAFGVYELTFAGPTVTSSDCADTAMAAVTGADEAVARAAYECLGPTMRTTSEDQFVSGMRNRGAMHGQFDRVADKRTADGGRIVFYTVTAAQGPSVGYIVYLDSDGKIVKVE